jgi:hypothetical protein
MLKVKPQKSPKYSHFRILLKAAERLGIFSAPIQIQIEAVFIEKHPQICYNYENNQRGAAADYEQPMERNKS